MRKSAIGTAGVLIILAGVVSFLAAMIITPQFAERYLSPDRQITLSGLDQLRGYRLGALILGGSTIIAGGVLLGLAPPRSTRSEDLLKTITSKRIVLVSAVSAWAILYLAYVLTHDIPVNPAGFYLESARQLSENGFLLPQYVDGFGEEGIPFAFPPLGFYVLAAAGYLFGSVHEAALYVPGLLLPVQAIAAYSFVKRWTGSEHASQWTAVFLLLMPHLFFRTLYGDGITTGLAGVFLLLSWRLAVTQDKPGPSLTPLIRGLLIGLSLLSHPAIGLFCAASFTVLYFSRTGFDLRAITRLIPSGITALVVILPWLLTVIAVHGPGSHLGCPARRQELAFCRQKCREYSVVHLLQTC